MVKFLTLTDSAIATAPLLRISPTGTHTFVAELDALKEEMAQAMRWGWNDIVITGGEPTMMKTFCPSCSTRELWAIR